MIDRGPHAAQSFVELGMLDVRRSTDDEESAREHDLTPAG